MTKTEVRFSIDWGETFAFPYRVDMLRIGGVVHISFDTDGNVHHLDHHPFAGSLPHCITAHGPNGPYARLSTGPKFQEGRRIYVWQRISKWVTIEQFDKALELSNSRLRTNLLYTNAETERSLQHLLDNVYRRLDLCIRLRGLDQEDKLWADGTPLQVYLYLTCFDLLGQPEPHLNFHDWLTKNESELEEFIHSEGVNGIEASKHLWLRYNELFGNRRAFHRFIYTVLDPIQRAELLDCIIWRERGFPPDMNQVDITNESFKIKVLYSLRNDYTHSAKYVPDGVQAMRGYDVSYGDIVMKDRIVRPRFRHWPAILEETVVKGVANRVLMELEK